MSKIFNFYTKNSDGIDVDRTWYQSSNVKYSECLDYDNKLKTLRIVFNNGTQYEYKDVNSTQYLLFREDPSQGKALNKFIKGNKYEFEKLENADIQEINDELNYRFGGGNFLELTANGFNILDNKDNILYSSDITIGEDLSNAIVDIVKLFGHKIKLVKKNYKTVIRITDDDLDNTKEKEN